MIRVFNLNVLKTVVNALIECEYNISIEIIYDEYFEFEIDHYEISLEKVK